MTDRDMVSFSEAMTVLGETFNETISPIRLAAYFDALSDHSIDDVLLAAGIANRTARFFPKPVELIELISGTAEDAWGEVLREVRRVGYVGTPHFESATALATIEAISGSWQQFCGQLPSDGPELIGWMKQFRSAFLVMTARHQEHTLTLQSADPAVLRAVHQLSENKQFPD